MRSEKELFRVKSRFEKWVRSNGGASRTAEKLHVTVSAVSRWVHKQRTPGPKMAQLIVETSHGFLTMKDIYDHTGF